MTIENTTFWNLFALYLAVFIAPGNKDSEVVFKKRKKEQGSSVVGMF